MAADTMDSVKPAHPENNTEKDTATTTEGTDNTGAAPIPESTSTLAETDTSANTNTNTDTDRASQQMQTPAAASPSGSASASAPAPKAATPSLDQQPQPQGNSAADRTMAAGDPSRTVASSTATTTGAPTAPITTAPITTTAPSTVASPAIPTAIRPRPSQTFATERDTPRDSHRVSFSSLYSLGSTIYSATGDRVPSTGTSSVAGSIKGGMEGTVVRNSSGLLSLGNGMETAAAGDSTIPPTTASSPGPGA
ncbi:hypothetical protein EMPG_15961, partial [Blastomyces silverae]